MAAMVDIPGLASRAILGIGLNAAMRYSTPDARARIIESQTRLTQGKALISTQAGMLGQHIGYEFINPATQMREMYDTAGNLLVALPIQYAGQTAGLLFSKIVASAAAVGGLAAGIFGLPSGQPLVIEDTTAGQEQVNKILGPELPTASEQPLGPPAGTQEMTQAVIENLMRRNAGLYGDVVVEDEPPSSDFDVLVDRPGTAARGRVPPPPYDIDGATTLTGNAGLGLDQFVPPVVPPLNAPRERQQAMHNIIVKEVMDKQNKAYNRIDNIQSRTATQRIANLETPLYDYSQTSARIRGLQPGNRPVII